MWISQEGDSTSITTRVLPPSVARGKVVLEQLLVTLSTRMLWANQGLEEAVVGALDEVTKLGYKGGLLVLDRTGHAVVAHTTPGFAVGYINSEHLVILE